MNKHTVRPVYRAMTDAERRAAEMLVPDRVTYYPGSPDKRFAKHLRGLLTLVEPIISDAQAEYLRRLAYRYRKQAPWASGLLEST